jgi:hypothetical protein
MCACDKRDMTRLKNKYPMFRGLFYFILWFGWISLIVAQSSTQQTKQWTNLSFRGSFFNAPAQWIYLLDLQSRYHFDPNEFEEGLIRAGLGFQSTPNLSLWGGYQWTSHNQFTGRNQLNTLWQQLLWDIINQDQVHLISQSRIEERGQQNQAQWNIRFRQQVIIEFPKTMSNKLTPVFWDEVFFNITKPSWVSSKTLEQNRAFLGVNILMSTANTLSVGYLNQYQFKSTTQQMNHIIFIGLTVKQ